MTRARVLFLVLALAACGSDEPAGPGGSTSTATLSGSLAASDGRTGRITLSGQVPSPSLVGGPMYSLSGTSGTRAVISLTGSVQLSDGSTATLTGTWDNVTGALNVTGGGFSFSGTLLNGSLSGSFTGPSITGVFSLQMSTTDTDAAVFCGTFTGRSPDILPSGGNGNAPDNGTWNLVVGASTVTAIILSDEGDSPLVLGGTRSGTTITLTVPGGTATGTLKGGANEFIDGQYNVPGSSSGTFQGSQASCTATTQVGTIASLTMNHPAMQPGNQFLSFDSVLVFVTARDAAGNVVAAPDLVWSYTGPVRSNNAVTPRGQKWLVSIGTASASVTARSAANANIQVTAVLIQQ